MKAFPHTGSFGPGTDAKQGMDLRDYFAAAALPTALGIVNANPNFAGQSNATLFANAAAMAYALADAMMTNR